MTPPEKNWAEHETHMQTNPSTDECRRMGETHYAYGWARTPYGSWTEEQKAAYYEGFDSAKKRASEYE